jgi:hypothetical protein
MDTDIDQQCVDTMETNALRVHFTFFFSIYFYFLQRFFFTLQRHKRFIFYPQQQHMSTTSKTMDDARLAPTE